MTGAFKSFLSLLTEAGSTVNRTSRTHVHGLYAHLPHAHINQPVASCSPYCAASGFASRHFLGTSSLAAADTSSTPTPANKQTSTPASPTTRPPSVHSLPDALKQELPRVIHNPPWVPAGKDGFVRRHARAIMAILQDARRQETKLTSEQVHAKLQAEGRLGGATSDVTPAKTRELLEKLRFERMVVGSKNMKADLQQGHPDYPYLYTALPFQAAHKGPPTMVQAQLELQKRKAVEQALRRLRSRKPPFQIHRVQARTSSFQHALAHEAVVKASRQPF
ncbi:hypothetical protein DUNSADRAFT_4920 [Dunaliella salina]|uniref:Uncharacterized protein n=1 Tax=Dunaliella salina TaxID=3046 RepID=A0ABQ7GR02_DUNSA|nr:hypothetical protein DUNSADRAFT_4920 [Dunaliella salina]|eukprot:KAF5837040.1 hypothetical protein DUNSADRAFT_4920 [Dunaliella salina]